MVAILAPFSSPVLVLPEKETITFFTAPERQPLYMSGCAAPSADADRSPAIYEGYKLEAPGTLFGVSASSLSTPTANCTVGQKTSEQCLDIPTPSLVLLVLLVFQLSAHGKQAEALVRRLVNEVVHEPRLPQKRKTDDAIETETAHVCCC